MDCGSVVQEQVEVSLSFDGTSNQIVHVVQAPSIQNDHSHGSMGMAKLRDHIHVDDMTDEEIHQTWYTKEDIRQFKKDRKIARQMRKRQIQLQRQRSDSSYSSTSTTSSSASEKRVSWGMSETTGLVSPDKKDSAETTVTVVPTPSPPQLKMASPGIVKKRIEINPHSPTSPRASSTGAQYRILMKAQRGDSEQERMNEMHKALFTAGLLYRGENDRDSQYLELIEDNNIFTDSSREEEEDDDHEEEEKENQEPEPPIGTKKQTKDETKSKISDVMRSKQQEFSDMEMAAREMEEITELLEVRESLSLEFSREVDKEVTHRINNHREEAKIDLLNGQKTCLSTSSSDTADQEQEYTKDQTQRLTKQPSEEVIFLPSPDTKRDEVAVLSKRSSYDSNADDDEVLFNEDPFYNPKRPVISNQSTELSTIETPTQSGPSNFSFPSYPACYEKPEYSFDTRLEYIDSKEQRSPDLLPLTRDYQDFRRKLNSLVKSVRNYLSAMIQLNNARSMCFEHCANLIQGPHSRERTPGSFQCSVDQDPMMKLQELAHAQHVARNQEYRQAILEYVFEWERVVTSKVDAELKQVKKLQQSRLHYEKKVEGLRRKVNALDSKGKELSLELIEKLKRNEEKLKDAWEVHEVRSSCLCALIEEVVQYGWKDLYPLVANLMKFEFNRSGGELAMYGKYPLMMQAFEATYHPEEGQFES